MGKKSMKINLIRLLMLTSLSGVTSYSFAGVPMPGYFVPQNVGVLADGTLEIMFDEVINPGCTSGEGKRIFVKVGNSQGVTESSFKQINSIVLAALVAQKPIKFWYDRIGTVCEGGKVNIIPALF